MRFVLSPTAERHKVAALTAREAADKARTAGDYETAKALYEVAITHWDAGAHAYKRLIIACLPVLVVEVVVILAVLL